MEDKNKANEQSILDNLESSLSGLSQSLLELGVAASEVPTTEQADGEGQSSGVVSNKVQESLHHLANIDNLKKFTETRVPLEVIDHVDQGKNPNLYTKDYVEQVAGENMFMNGKLSSMKTYEDMLAVALSENFADLSEEIEKRRI